MHLLAKRGTRSQVDAAAVANGLLESELIYLTDEAKFAVATATDAYVDVGASPGVEYVFSDRSLTTDDNLMALICSNARRVTLPVGSSVVPVGFQCDVVASPAAGVLIIPETSLVEINNVSSPPPFFVPPGQRCAVLKISSNAWRLNNFGEMGPSAQIVQKSSSTSTGASTSVFSGALVEPGDLLILAVETANQPITVPSGFTAAPAGAQGTGTAGGVAATRLEVFYRIATGSESLPVSVANPGDHVIAMGLLIKNVDTANPFDATAGNVASSATTAVSLPSATATRNDGLILSLAAIATDATFVLGANAALKRLQVEGEQITLGGNRGRLTAVTGIKSAPGATGVTTGTLANAQVQARWTGVINAR